MAAKAEKVIEFSVGRKLTPSSFLAAASFETTLAAVVVVVVLAPKILPAAGAAALANKLPVDAVF